jgi:phosphoglycolate phosphatase-like HAD superfamily hydrolase
VTDQLRPGALFDVDDTLIDTHFLHALAWSRALRDAGEWAPMNAIHRLVGMGSDQLLPELPGHDSPPTNRRPARPLRRTNRRRRRLPRCRRAPSDRARRGLAVVLASSASDGELTVLRKILGADDAVDAVTSGDDIDRTKPDPEVFVTAMRVAGIDPRRALAVGDSVWDIRAARVAGIGCVAVESRGFSQHELSEAGALTVYQDVDELRRQLNTSSVALLLNQGS